MDSFSDIMITGYPVQLALAVLFLPLLSFLVLFFFGNKLPRKGDFFAAALSGLSFLLSVLLFLNVWGMEVLLVKIPWFNIQSLERVIEFSASIKIDDLSVLMLLLVSFISFLVHLYSIEYMKGKKNYVRYFPYLGLFTFSMTGVVLSDNLLVTFMFWELVGFSSYLLIGFWYEKEEANRAAKKAFLFNRIGDTGFILALVAVYSLPGNSFELSVINASSLDLNNPLFYLIGLGIFAGSIGKSAQFPLQAWLPDAMEGPTPVSALIHAATMVAAGVYLLLKTYFLLSPDVLIIIALFGSLTAFAGAVPALFQHDIKKVLAFSTISQLGYMIMAIGVGAGVGANSASFFHLIAHGFFKAGLFLAAGAVIHNMHHIKHDLFIKGQYKDFDSQDMRLMGGFRKIMPVTFAAFLICSLALIGLPLFSGFLSKDAILEAAFNWQMLEGNTVLYIVPFFAGVTVFITALYMCRQVLKVFFGNFRLTTVAEEAKQVFSHLKDPSWLMQIPLFVLSFFCFWFVFSPNPFSTVNGWWFRIETGWVTEVISIVLALSGILLGVILYGKTRRASLSTGKIGDYLRNNWYIDRIYYGLLVKPGFYTSNLLAWIDRKVIDGFIHGLSVFGVVFAHITAWFDRFFIDGAVHLTVWIASQGGGLARSLQAGKIQGYFVAALFLMLLLIIWIIIA